MSTLGNQASGTPVTSTAVRPAPPTLAEVVALLDQRYPPRTAESWDRVGLVTGDPDQPVRRVLFAVDPVAVVVQEALDWGGDLIITHHPLLLRAVHSVAATNFKGALLHRLIRGGVALYAAHTNADSARGGVADQLADLIGLTQLRPLSQAPSAQLDKYVVFVPSEQAGSMVDALSTAGAGELGEYSRCAWATTGEGTFIPGAQANPTVGRPGELTRVVEARVEMIAPRPRRADVIAALRAAHPYEEPAFDVLELVDLGSDTGIGRVGELAETTTLHAFAERIAKVLPPTEQGIRYAGPSEAPVRTVAVVGGAGDSMFDLVRASGADAYVTSDLRHHPASELREQAEFVATGGADSPPYLVDTAHFASEWPWLAGAQQALVADLSRIGTTVESRVSTLRTDPWTGRVPSPVDPEGPES